VAGNLAWIAWPHPVALLDGILREQTLVGQVLTGQPAAPFIGALAPNAFEQRLRSVMDPHARFSES